MATPQLVSIRDFNTSVYSQLADTSTANVGDLLVAAEQTIQRRLNRPILPTTYVERFFPNTNTLYLRRRPVISITSFTRAALPLATGLNVVNYTFDPEAGVIDSITSIVGYHVVVTYVAGFTEVPADIKQAILMQTALMAFQDLELYGSGDAKEPAIDYMRRDITNLLEPYKQLHVAYTERYG